MKLSELIIALETLRHSYGDIEVYVASDEEANRVKDLGEYEVWTHDQRANSVLVLFPGWVDLEE